MKTLYLDCTSGVSGDMVGNALAGICEDPGRLRRRTEEVRREIEEMTAEHHGGEHSEHHSGHHFHRSYSRVQEIIRGLSLDEGTKETALRIYRVIAGAESRVHGDPLESLHFHEVGRNQAIVNAVGAALCAGEIGADRILCSEICDGHGTVECAHGTLEVPVPAVKAMLEEAAGDEKIRYRQTEQEGERVTPSGLAMVIGIGAVFGDKPEGTPVRQAEAKGGRDPEGRGMIISLYED